MNASFAKPSSPGGISGQVQINSAGVFGGVATTSLGLALIAAANPSAVRFIRINADNSISELDAASFLAAIGGTGGGYITSGGGITTFAAPDASYNMTINGNGKANYNFSVGDAWKFVNAGTKFRIDNPNSTLGFNVQGTIFDHFATVSTTHTDGTEDDLYTDTLIANGLVANGDKLQEEEEVTMVSSATASRRLKKYFAGTLIFDTGSVTPGIGAITATLRTTIIRESSSVVRCLVSAIGTAIGLLPPSTYTRITGLDLANNTSILKTTGIASGTGAASADISNVMGYIDFKPAQ